MKPRLSLQARMRRRPAERGFILVIGLLFMLVLLMLSAAMFRSFTLQEKVAGNTRDKQRSFEVAQGAVQFGENWLNNGNAQTPVLCSGGGHQPIGSLTVCSNQLATPQVLTSWNVSYDYLLLPTSQVAQGGGVIANGDIIYQAQPGVHIYSIGLNAAQDSMLYQVTAFGGGGSSDTESVIQSTYRIPVSITPNTVTP